MYVNDFALCALRQVFGQRGFDEEQCRTIGSLQAGWLHGQRLCTTACQLFQMAVHTVDESRVALFCRLSLRRDVVWNNWTITSALRKGFLKKSCVAMGFIWWRNAGFLKEALINGLAQSKRA